MWARVAQALEKASWILLGAVLASGYFAWRGNLQIAGDFWANVVGATIGGLIAVALALAMYDRERKAAAADAAQAALDRRTYEIDQALRHVRAISECVEGARALSINTSARILPALQSASILTSRKLEDVNLTDFPLRLAMEDARLIAISTHAQLTAALSEVTLEHAAMVPSSISPICDDAEAALRKLQDDYRAIRLQRTVPVIL